MSTTPTPKTANNVFVLTPKHTPKQLFNAMQSVEDLKSFKQDYCRETHEFVFEQIIHTLRGCGMMYDTERVNRKELILLESALEAVIYRYQGLEHQFHDIAEQLISISDEENSDSEIDDGEQLELNIDGDQDPE